MNKPKLIVICGTTASGKTALGVEIAKKYNGELINADSRQVYRGMDIGTNKEIPDGVPLHLVDIVNSDERYTAYQFKIDAAVAIQDIISRGKVPILVGGTGMWIDSLIYNYQLPKKPVEELSFEMPETLEEQVAELLRVDPDAADLVDLKNPRRVVRALQVYYETGVPFTMQPKMGEAKYDVLKIAPKVDFDTLEPKIVERTEQMMTAGLTAEVASLVRQYGWEHTAMTGIGYREYREVIGDIWHDPSEAELAQIKKLIATHTRQYAKRQLTWFKRDPSIHWVRGGEEAIAHVDDFIKNSRAA